MPAVRESCRALSNNFFIEMYKMREMYDGDFFAVTQRENRIHPEIEGDPVEKRNALTQLRKDIFLQLEDLIPCRYLDIEGIEVTQ